MLPQQVHSYLHNFFQENNSRIISNDEHFMMIQLTADMDKRIMNRPYYWKYIESTDTKPIPSSINLDYQP